LEVVFLNSEMPNRASTTIVGFLLLLPIFVFGCAPTKGTQLSNEDQVKSILGSTYTVSFNDSKKFALYQQARVNDHVNRSFKYVVLRISDNKIVKQGSFRNGYVKWINDTSIEIASAGKGETFDKNVVNVENQTSY
jgi:hypothetical protein